jgi:hypothetical protein
LKNFQNIFLLAGLLLCINSAFAIDTNWQTSWITFDANMKGQYQLNTLNTQHWHTITDFNWSNLRNFPSACPTGYALNDINDNTFSCIPPEINDTNWQTSWTLLDANLRATYFSRDSSKYSNFFDDFDGSTIGKYWTPVNSGAGASQTQVDSVFGENTYGVIQINKGTTGSSRAALTRGTGSILLGQGKFSLVTKARVPVLSPTNQGYAMQLGLHDNTAEAATDGVFFSYSEKTNSNHLIYCETENNTTGTKVSSGVTMTTDWIRYKIEINAAGTEALFYINGNLVCTITTNIPTGSGRVTGPRIQITNNGGAATEYIQTDYWGQTMEFTTAR